LTKALTGKGEKMAKRTSYHVTFNKSDDSWHVQKAGGQKSSGNFDTQQQAISAARGFTQNLDKSQILVHRKDNGQIRTESTYGDDPYPPKG
jgi:hypothetical protein